MRSGSLRDLGMGGAVRQPAEDDIDRRSNPPRSAVTSVGRSRLARCGKHLRERLPGMALGDQRRKRDVGMTRGEPDQIGAGIAGGAEHRGSDGFVSHGEAYLSEDRGRVLVRHTGESRYPAIDD